MSVARDDDAMSCAIAVILACFPGAAVIGHFDERVAVTCGCCAGTGRPERCDSGAVELEGIEYRHGRGIVLGLALETIGAPAASGGPETNSDRWRPREKSSADE